MARNYGLDLARIVAAYMVMAGHLIFGGSVATGRPYSDWAGKSEALPLLNNNSLWKLDNYLLGAHGTALAIIGVSLFFLISGWLMPPMLKKYSRPLFLLNRFLRIFPMLVIAVLLAAVIQYYGGDKTTLDKAGILATATLTTTLTGKPLTLGVVWTLIIEFEFYLLLAVLGLLTQRKILMACMGIIALTAACSAFKIQSNPLLPDLYFVIYMFIGSSARLAVDDFKSSGRRIVLCRPALVLLAFEFNRYLLVTILGLHPGQDINAVSLAITAALFVAFTTAGNVIAKNDLARWLVEQSADLTYSIYLTHLALGIFLISRLRHYLHNDYTALIVTFSLVTLLSIATYRFIELPGIKAFKKITLFRDNLRFRKRPPDQQ